MAKLRKYTFNSKTLSYEVQKRSRKSRVMRSLGVFMGSILLSVFYFWLYTAVLGKELPKTSILKKINVGSGERP